MQQTTEQATIPPIPPNGLIEGVDFEVKQIGNGPYPWHWEGLGDYAQWESSEGEQTLDNARAHAFKELATLALPDLNYQPALQRDFMIYPLYGLFYWESCGDVFADAYRCKDGFKLPSDAESNAINFLTSLDPETAAPAATEADADISVFNINVSNTSA
ncbi:MAG: hypothetical protein WA885_11405 [Phormidesmis sp.]